MAIADMLKAGGGEGGKAAFDCPKYDPLPSNKRCRHYLDNGACALPDEFMCVEWLKANDHTPAPIGSQAQLFGGQPEPVASPLPTRLAPPRVVPKKPDEPDQPPPRGLTTEDIDSFKALKAEVCMSTPHLGELWLVPEYTGQDRRELTPEHAGTLYQVLAVFPGAQVVSFEKSPTTDEEDPS